MKKIFFILFIAINIYAYDAFISAKQLHNILGEKNLIVIDVSENYKKSHIVDAYYFNVDLLTKHTKYSPLKEKEDIQELFRELGINNYSNIVIYGRNTKKDIKNSAFLAYVLITYGFENVSILDGGYMAWVFEYDVLTTAEITEQEDGFITLRKKKTDVKYDEIKKDTLLIDTRYPQKYYGVSSKKDEKYLGHIPGAKNSYYAYKFLKDKTIRDQKDLDKIYKDGLKLDSAKTIVVYGKDVKEAAIEWFIIYKRMGYINAKLYYNSFKEYVERGLNTERFKWE